MDVKGLQGGESKGEEAELLMGSQDASSLRGQLWARFSYKWAHLQGSRELDHSWLALG